MTLLKQVREALEPFANSLVAQTDVAHPSQDWRDETDNTIVSIQTSHQRKGMPYLSPDRTLAVGDFRRARAALAALEAAPPPSQLVEKLKALANYLDEKHEYEAVELIDCAVDRIAGVALEAAPTDEMVERVARAIYEADYENNSPYMWEMERSIVLDLFRDYARAAIAAMGVK